MINTICPSKMKVYFPPLLSLFPRAGICEPRGQKVRQDDASSGLAERWKIVQNLTERKRDLSPKKRNFCSFISDS